MSGHRATISPVPAGVQRPKWSVMIPTYNCAPFLAETLAGVLAQAAGSDKMQIEVVDDGSTDDPEAVVRTVGKGRVGFFRQPRNVGHIHNFATCLERATGELVHLLHGDDRVEPGFYEKLQSGFDSDPRVGAAFCRHRFIDEAGAELSVSAQEQGVAGPFHNAVERMAQEQIVMTPSIAVRREVYEELGGFDDRLICSEDWEMWVRIAAVRPIWYEPEILASYRMHGNSNTGRHYRLAQELKYTRLAMDIFSEYLPAEKMGSIMSKARANYAATALANARRLAAVGDRRGMYAHLGAAVRFNGARSMIRAARIALLPRKTA